MDSDGNYRVEFDALDVDRDTKGGEVAQGFFDRFRDIFDLKEVRTRRTQWARTGHPSTQAIIRYRRQQLVLFEIHLIEWSTESPIEMNGARLINNKMTEARIEEDTGEYESRP